MLIFHVIKTVKNNELILVKDRNKAKFVMFNEEKIGLQSPL